MRSQGKPLSIKMEETDKWIRNITTYQSRNLKQTRYRLGIFVKDTSDKELLPRIQMTLKTQQ